MVRLAAKRVHGGLFKGEVVVGGLSVVEVTVDVDVVVLDTGAGMVKSVGDGISMTIGSGCVIGG